MARALLVAHQHMLQLGGAVQGVIDRQNRPARITEEDVHALLAECLDYHLGAGHQAGFGLLSGLHGHGGSLGV